MKKKWTKKTQVRHLKRFLLMLFCCFATLAYAQAQSTTITGTVKDDLNEPLVGVSVVIKGTTQGTMTNADGQYTVKVDEPNAVLVFSLVGSSPQEIKVGNRTVINVLMKENSQLLDEIVVVGFQSQKKVNLTGSVASVGSDVLENRPVANIGQALQGVVPNLNISTSSGAPDKVPDFNIRGGTSLKRENDDPTKNFILEQGAPLILMDGVEITQGQLNQLNPNDISDIVLLKDASSAAIYGTRASAGVILVTTKGGNFDQKARVNYSFDMSWDTASATPDVLDSYTRTKAMSDRSFWHDGVEPSKETLETLERMKAYLTGGPAWYDNSGTIQWVASVDPYKEMLRDWTPMQKHNASVTGGSKNINYYASVGMQDQEGMYKIGTDSYKRYNTMLNLNAKISERFKVGAKVSYVKTKYYTPLIAPGKGNLWAAALAEAGKNITMPIHTAPDDPIPNAPTNNILAFFDAGANSTTHNTTTILSVAPEFTIIPKELVVKADFSYTPRTYKMKRSYPRQERINDIWVANAIDQTAQNDGDLTQHQSDLYVFNAYADYKKSFNKAHNFNVLLGFNQERFNKSTQSVNMKRLFDPFVLNPALVEDITQNRSSAAFYEKTGRAVFGRLTYNFEERYLFEMNARYDGSSKFNEDDRFQFFPTFAGAWRISEEKFMTTTRSWLDNLKLRGSWGNLGTQPYDSDRRLSYYPYQKSMGGGSGKYIIDGKLVSGVNPPGLGNPFLKWEQTETVNFGLDIIALNNRVEFTMDIYRRTTKNILSDAEGDYPGVLGVPNKDFPDQNLGKIRAQGFEIAIKWRDKLSNGLSYDIGFILGDTQNKVLEYKGNKESKLDKLYPGYKIGDIWGYETGGIMQEKDMYKEGNKWFFNGVYQGTGTIYPGDVWYKDTNGDGVFSNGQNTLADPGDQKVIGNNTPRYKYGITLNLAYKGFDLNMFFQGVGKRDLWISSSTYWGGGAGSAGSQWMYDRSWTPEKTDAKFPMYGGGAPSYKSTGYVVDGSYFRMKQMVVGYTLPKKLTHKMFLDNIRLHVSAYNLFEITDIPNLFDVDQISDQYPQKRTIAFGVQIGF